MEHAQLYTRPPDPPPIVVAAAGKRTATLAGRIGDGMIAVTPDARLVDAFEAAGGTGKPRIGQLRVCWADTIEQARATARRWWPTDALPGRVLAELAQPDDFAALTSPIGEQAVAGTMVLGPDPQPHLDAIARFAAAGFNEVYVHQVGPAQPHLLDFYAQQILPQLNK